MPGTLIRVHVLENRVNFLYVVTLLTLPPKCMKLLKLVFLFLHRIFPNFLEMILPMKNPGLFLLNIVVVRILRIFGMPNVMLALRL
nr:MAG TPA: hypothetical protein [Microviridae sp.]